MKKLPLITTAYFCALFTSSSWSVPFAPFDARGMAMGGTGVASAKWASAVYYNPSLLVQGDKDEDFSFVFPQIGINIADDEEVIETADDFINDEDANGNNIFDRFDVTIDLLDQDIENIQDTADAIIEISELLNSGDALSDKDYSQLNQLSSQTTQLNTELASLDTNTDSLQSDTFELTDALLDLSEKSLRGTFGGGGAIAIPGKSTAVGLHVNANVVFSGMLIVNQRDTSLIESYANAADTFTDEAVLYGEASDALVTATQQAQNIADNPSDFTIAQAEAALAELESAATSLDNQQNILTNFTYGGSDREGEGDEVIFVNGEIADEDPELASTIHMIGVAISEVGISIAHQFSFKGRDVAIGITPKMQNILLYDYIHTLSDEDFDAEDIEATEQEYDAFNLDIGFSTRLGTHQQWQIGALINNLLSDEYDTIAGRAVEINTGIRVGAAYHSKWFNIAADLDLIENQPVAFESGTQYLAMGAEFDVFRLLQLRTGFRANLSDMETSIITAGVGFSPFGLHTDIAVLGSDKEIGLVLQTGLHF